MHDSWVVSRISRPFSRPALLRFLVWACLSLSGLMAGTALAAVSSATPDEESIPPIGTIDYYGLRTVTAARIHQMLGLKPGDPAPVDPTRRRELERRIA